MSKQRRRDTMLTIRLIKAEKERIERNAKRAERSITDYLVLLSLETPIHVAEDVKPLFAVASLVCAAFSIALNKM